MAASPSADLAGTVLGRRYRLVRQLGRGGMGAVYEAVQLDLGRTVAVKVIVPDLAEEPEVMARFRREAEAAASLRHPNIVQVTDFSHAPPEPAFLVMELLQGRSLKDIAKPYVELDETLVRGIAMQVLGALDAAHRTAIVHRDLKPDNIFLVDVPGVGPMAKLLDFGVAKLTESRGYARLTATGVLVGTPAYMASEQLAGRPVDARTDLYALGATMFRMLTGKLPYQGLDLGERLRAMMQRPPPRVLDERPDVDPGLSAIVARAMTPDPAARFQSAREMAAALADPSSKLATQSAVEHDTMISSPATIATGRAPQFQVPQAAPRVSMPAVQPQLATDPMRVSNPVTASTANALASSAMPSPTVTPPRALYAVGGVVAGVVIAGAIAFALGVRPASTAASVSVPASASGAADPFANARSVTSERLALEMNPPQQLGQVMPANAGPAGEAVAQAVLGCFEAHDLVPTRAIVEVVSILVLPMEGAPRITVADTETNSNRLECLRVAAGTVQLALPGGVSGGVNYMLRIRPRS